MAEDLSPEQQTALDQFTEDAQAAAAAKRAAATAQEDLTAAQELAASSATANVEARQKAQVSGRAFLALMLPPEGTDARPAGRAPAGAVRR